jgi:UDP-N-acetylmuramoyl-L-alanyl-D-glutamate--2,6-diaminopimelate ligase
VVRLAELVRALGGTWTPGEGDGPALLDVTLDSREAQRGTLFAALAGAAADGARFAPGAVERGAAAVLCDRPLELGGAPLWTHPAPRRTAGLAADLVHGTPTADLFVAAVTGTNGKTSVAHFAAQLLEAGGRRPALLGTAGHRLAGGTDLAATHTTPDAPALHRLLARHRAGGGDAAVLEASSHGLDQDRLVGVRVDAAVFTNLSRDHLDYHADEEAYLAAKLRLFEGLDGDAVAAVNADDPVSERVVRTASEAGARVVRYGAAADADLRVEDHRLEGGRGVLRLAGLDEGGSVELRLASPARWMAENAVAALAAARVAGVTTDVLIEAVPALRAAPGRLEPVEGSADRPRVYVDYAHTPDALERALEVCRAEAATRGGRLVVVFGCGGERDRGKRPLMGAVAARLADRCVITSDNPRGEDPEAILEDVAVGATGGAAEVDREPDRRAAIARAIETAAPGDVVLVAGRGHETHQLVAGERVPLDDREVAREMLR